MSELTRFRPQIWFSGAAVAVAVIYISTLQTIPNGSSHYYMIDVGETQIVLNVWGTLHATGYPLYVILGNLLTAVLRLFGVDLVIAPALVSMLWGYVTLILLYALTLHLTRRAWLAALTVLLFGLIRSVWIHFVIAEIYTFGTAIVMGLLYLALYRGEIKGRIYWLALLGGIGIAHHRATAMMILALLYAVWPYLMAQRKRLPQIVIGSLLLGAFGFVQYAYLYLRADAGADWVYGQPGTFRGLWDEFTGKEASRFIGLADSADALIENFNIVNQVLIRDLTAPGILMGIIGLLIGLLFANYRRTAITMLLLALVSYIFHVAFYSDVLSALILQVIVPLVFGWALFAVQMMEWLQKRPHDLLKPTYAPYAAGVVALIFAAVLFAQNNPFIHDVTTDRTGLQTIEQVRAAPPGSTVMLAWGPRYFAVALAHDLQDDLTHIDVVDDKADFPEIASRSMLVTPEYTLFAQPLDWWQGRIGSPVYLQTVAPGLVVLNPDLNITEGLPDGITVAEETLICEQDRLILDVLWQTDDVPEADLSVFVHALSGDNPAPVAQADVFAPVYGWRPLTTWLAGEQVRDIYTLAISPAQVDRIRYGMYRVFGDGQFENVLEYEIAVDCDEST